ncbi:MAG: hypothetical protein COW73_04150 [Nitrospirae bacterium CG18_big_fil_WC_8_21_14_2_50_70_55]|nr:hypothetical protein [Deltaproteobacteria bacterium]PIQ06092.1 MAG: hypothetical protein COW73_04150 [Nitrospirae bacterium CG18_big_fil_WC_8_21_14_2_50_70_55]PIW83042.1 MAG: hypothetical protein COZ96_05455 [Nitrospirae bacterium CG_4_8_14_3_um_filter_70_85]PIX82773.1 MAG: hypothetical protein COZ33_08955 [Nitrospirae bacterium CG_4_10_14_3_um_filter_70_108]PJB95349.1 MAG: hypothetical protein CO080_08440 [Nitrospirae bacterium CG_4_9_14_0_8_um_filter_70_14]HBB41525.1 hypothetical protein 
MATPCSTAPVMTTRVELVSLCARCSTRQTTCCQKTEIYLTPGDVRRIAGATGLTDFCEFSPPVNPAYGDQADDPAWARAVFRPDGSRRILRHQGNGDCCFLGATGCSLPAAAKPLICRIYPYEYANGRLTGLATTCPVDLLGPDDALPAAVGMPPLSECAAWVAQLYREILVTLGSGLYFIVLVSLSIR